MWYKWDFQNDGKYDTIQNPNNPFSNYVYSKKGNYTIKLHVQDDTWLEDTNIAYVIIKEKNEQDIEKGPKMKGRG